MKIDLGCVHFTVQEGKGFTDPYTTIPFGLISQVVNAALRCSTINLRGPPSSSLNYKGSVSRETLTAKRHTGC